MKKALSLIFAIAFIVGVGFVLKEIVLATPTIDPTLSAILDDPSITKNRPDWTDTLGVESVANIKFKVSNDKVTIRYGKMKFDVKKKDFTKKEVKEALDKIGLKLYENKNGKVILMYGKERVDEVV